MPSFVPTPSDGIVWMTGASSGIGRAAALEFARRGFSVAATARSADALATLASEAPEGSIFAVPGDVTDLARMRSAVAEIEARGPIAVAILNAGTYVPTRAHPFDADAFRRTFDVNLMGIVHGLDPLIAPMVARGRGQIWIVSSVAGYGPLPAAAAYGASKAALIAMAGSLKFDLDRHGVHVGVINPGFVDTPLTAKNDFEMPFLMPVEEAARRIADGIARPRFEITFPRRFALILKALNLLPWRWYFPLIARGTKWEER